MIAFLGTGLMGSGFVSAMLDHGDAVTVWNRTIPKTAKVQEEQRLVSERARIESDEQIKIREQEQLRQDTLASWEEYQLTGLHVTAKEADAWLAKLEAGKDSMPPKCHV